MAGGWLGGGAAALGLQGRVQDQALLAVLAGYEPGAQQRQHGWIGRQLVAPPRVGKRCPGFDACFKAPKSVSLLWAFGDEVQVGARTLDQVVEMAHDEAVREAIAYLEASAAKGRRGRNGAVQMDSSGFVGAAFRQRTSRAGDPHLHSHVLIANLCQGTDGRWGALDARLIYAHAKAAGYLYEAHLRHRLTSELGVDWGDVVHGIADVAGVPEQMIDHFSKRSREIRSRLHEVTERINQERERLGLAPVEADSQEALDIAARETRAAKLQHIPTADLRAGWHVEAAGAGLHVEQLAGAIHRAEEQPPVIADPELHHRVTAGLTENASTFGRRDAVQALAADARRGLPVAEVLERASSLLASRDVIPVVGAVRDQDVIRRADGSVAPIPTGERRWSTPDMLAVEERLVASALRRRQDGAAVVPAGIIEETLRASLARLPNLGTDQVEMAAQLAGSGIGVECVEAAPGTGKTTALAVYVASCRRAGIPVVGCAPSARARDELRLRARINPCYTVDKLLLELARSRLEPGSVVVLDEASMAGSRKLLLLLRHQVRVLERHVKVVRWRQADRLVLAALARRLPRPSWPALLVKPETVLGWHRELVRRKWASFAGRPRRGRPSINEECRELIRQLANENTGWGYLRLKGELRKLGLEVSASTIRRVLLQHRIPPAPRRSALTWRGFLAAHAATIVATDFFSVDTVFLKRLTYSSSSTWRAAGSSSPPALRVQTQVGSRNRRATSAGS